MAYTLRAIESVLVGAFEGGSNFWIDEVKWSGYKQFLEGEVIHIKTDEMGTHDLDLKKLKKGIAQFRKAWNDPDYKGINYSNDKWYDLDSGVYDANDNDCMLQFALFGELVYG